MPSLLTPPRAPRSAGLGTRCPEPRRTDGPPPAGRRLAPSTSSLLSPRTRAPAVSDISANLLVSKQAQAGRGAVSLAPCRTRFLPNVAAVQALCPSPTASPCAALPGPALAPQAPLRPPRPTCSGASHPLPSLLRRLRWADPGDDGARVQREGRRETRGRRAGAEQGLAAGGHTGPGSGEVCTRPPHPRAARAPPRFRPWKGDKWEAEGRAAGVATGGGRRQRGCGLALTPRAGPASDRAAAWPCTRRGHVSADGGAGDPA